jgi:hypothetical protein
MLGKCALCLLQKDLQKSHLIPRSMYKKIRTRGVGNNDPMVATSDGSKARTSYQYQDYLLCWDCEQRFRANGEDYAAQVTQTRGRFPLLDTLNAAVADSEFKGLRAYSAASTPTIDRQRLAYFAISVFWRASIKTWYDVNDKEIRIELGSKYNEEVRRYLRGEASIPATATLTLGVCTDVLYQNMFHAPTLAAPEKHRVFGFLVCGLEFRLGIGKSAPPTLRSISMVNTAGQWISTGDCTKAARVKIVSDSKRQAAF